MATVVKRVVRTISKEELVRRQVPNLVRQLAVVLQPYFKGSLRHRPSVMDDDWWTDHILCEGGFWIFGRIVLLVYCHHVDPLEVYVRADLLSEEKTKGLLESTLEEWGQKAGVENILIKEQ